MRSSSNLPACPLCSGEMQEASYMHDATEKLWFIAFCLDCGYQAESKQERAALESALAAQGQGEAVAEVCSMFELRWAGGDAISSIVGRNGIKVGDKLYTKPTPPASPAGAPDGWRETILRVLSALDVATGDSDPNIDADLTDDEVRDEYPEVWAMQQLSAMLAAPSAPEGGEVGL